MFEGQTAHLRPFAKRWGNLKAALELHFAYYNFCRVHGSLRITPAMAVGITDHVWNLQELIRAKAASVAFHSSFIVALRPPSLPVLNCRFLIFSASSIPEIVTTALSNRLNPASGGFVASLSDGLAPPDCSRTGWIEPSRDPEVRRLPSSLARHGARHSEMIPQNAAERAITQLLP